MIQPCWPWRSFEAVEYTTPQGMHWFSHRRLLVLIGNIPPAEAAEQFYAAWTGSIRRRDSHPAASTKPGAVQGACPKGEPWERTPN